MTVRQRRNCHAMPGLVGIDRHDTQPPICQVPQGRQLHLTAHLVSVCSSLRLHSLSARAANLVHSFMAGRLAARQEPAVSVEP